VCVGCVNKSSAVAEMGDRLVTIDKGQKLGAVPLLGVGYRGGAGFPSNTMSPGPRPNSVSSGILIYPTVWPQQTWAEHWGLCPFGGRQSWVPIQHNVIGVEAYVHAKFHLDPSNRLATYTNVTDRTGQTDRTTVR